MKEVYQPCVTIQS